MVSRILAQPPVQSNLQPGKAGAKTQAPPKTSSSSPKRKTALATDIVSRTDVGTTRQNAHRKGVPGSGSRGGKTKLSARNAMPQLTAAHTKQAARRLEAFDGMAPKSLTESQSQDSAVLFDKAISSGKELFADIPSVRTNDFSALAQNKGAEDAWNSGNFSKLMPFSDLCRFPSGGVTEELKAHPRVSRAAAARSAAAKKAKSGKKAAKSPAKGKSKYAARRPAPARGAAKKWLTSADEYRTQIGFAAKCLTDEEVIQTFPKEAQNEIRRLGLAYVTLLKNLNDTNGDFQLAYAAALVDHSAEAAQGGADDPSNPQLLTGPNIPPTNLQPTDDEEDDDEYDDDDGAVVQDNSQTFADVDDMGSFLGDLDSPPLGDSARKTEDDADDLLSFYGDGFRPSAEPPLAAKNADGLDQAEAEDMAVANKHREDFDDAENAEIDLDMTLKSLQMQSEHLKNMADAPPPRAPLVSIAALRGAAPVQASEDVRSKTKVFPGLRRFLPGNAERAKKAQFINELKEKYGGKLAALAGQRLAGSKLTDKLRQDFESLGKSTIVNATLNEPLPTLETSQQLFMDSVSLKWKRGTRGQFDIAGTSNLFGGVGSYIDTGKEDNLLDAHGPDGRLAHAMDFFIDNQEETAKLASDKKFAEFWNKEIKGTGRSNDGPTCLLNHRAQFLGRLELPLFEMADGLKEYGEAKDAEGGKKSLGVIANFAGEFLTVAANQTRLTKLYGDILSEEQTIDACPKEHREYLRGLAQAFKDLHAEAVSPKGLIATAQMFALEAKNDPQALADAFKKRPELESPPPPSPSYIPTPPPPNEG